MDGYQSNDDPRILPPDQMVGLKYKGEDHRAYFLVDRQESDVIVLKNRRALHAPRAASSNPLGPAFQLLAVAFIGLAPAGLGTLIFAPLALGWTVAAALRRPPDRADRIRIAVVWGIAAGLLSLAIPMSLRFLERLS